MPDKDLEPEITPMKVAISLAVAAILIVVCIGIAFVTELGGLKWKGYFKPKHQDVERETFERTKSYVHAALQEIGNYKRQYDQAKTEEDREIIRNVVRNRFGEFDAELIKSYQLQSWFVEVRGY